MSEPAPKELEPSSSLSFVVGFAAGVVTLLCARTIDVHRQETESSPRVLRYDEASHTWAPASPDVVAVRMDALAGPDGGSYVDRTHWLALFGETLSLVDSTTGAQAPLVTDLHGAVGVTSIAVGIDGTALIDVQLNDDSRCTYARLPAGSHTLEDVPAPSALGCSSPALLALPDGGFAARNDMATAILEGDAWRMLPELPLDAEGCNPWEGLGVTGDGALVAVGTDVHRPARAIAIMVGALLVLPVLAACVAKLAKRKGHAMLGFVVAVTTLPVINFLLAAAPYLRR